MSVGEEVAEYITRNYGEDLSMVYVSMLSEMLEDFQYSESKQVSRQQWLREYYNIQVYVHPHWEGTKYTYQWNVDGQHIKPMFDVCNGTYEEAMQIGLDNAMKLIE